MTNKNRYPRETCSLSRHYEALGRIFVDTAFFVRVPESDSLFLCHPLDSPLFHNLQGNILLAIQF